MSAPSTDCVVRVKALRNIAKLFTGRSVEQQVFDTVMRSVHSNMWTLIDPATLSYKLAETMPKIQVINLIEKLGRSALATVFRTKNEDMTRTLYLLRLNPRMISKITRRKTKLYTVYGTGNVVDGDIIVVDDGKVNSEWLSKFVYRQVSDGINTLEYINLGKFDWERII